MGEKGEQENRIRTVGFIAGTTAQDVTTGIYGFYGSLGHYRYVRLTITDGQANPAAIKEFKVY